MIRSLIIFSVAAIALSAFSIPLMMLIRPGHCRRALLCWTR
jgi:hypothetical protein